MWNSIEENDTYNCCQKINSFSDSNGFQLKSKTNVPRSKSLPGSVGGSAFRISTFTKSDKTNKLRYDRNQSGNNESLSDSCERINEKQNKSKISSPLSPREYKSSPTPGSPPQQSPRRVLNKKLADDIERQLDDVFEQIDTGSNFQQLTSVSVDPQIRIKEHKNHHMDDETRVIFVKNQKEFYSQ
jgi:hypothetical protein